MMNTVLHNYACPEYGTQSEVVLISGGEYAVVLRDNDSGSAVAYAKLFVSESEAVDYARILIGANVEGA
jgi:hypothetical protein